VAALIPALNAAETIVDLIRKVERFIPRQHIIVVDDGSTDDTGRLALEAGAIVLSHDQNAGKGAALQTGFRYALADSCDGVIVLDADGQHEPRFIPDFIDRARKGDADILIGSRMDAVGQMPWIRQLTNRITSACVSALAGQTIPDSQSGYRYVGQNVLRAIRLKTSRYDTESEMLIKAGRQGYRIDSIPISSVYGTEESAIRPIRDTLRFVCLMLRSALHI
jgi:glycosyltransferase involved in cell wall biosynthesis